MDAAWFVDGAYLLEAWWALNRADHLDYLKLRSALETQYGHIAEARFFNSSHNPTLDLDDSFHSFLKRDTPSGVGFHVHLYWLRDSALRWPERLGGGPVVHPDSNEPYVQTRQKGVDCGIVFHLMQSFSSKGWQRLILAAGDGDFTEVVGYLKESGVSVILVGTSSSIRRELQDLADEIFELREHADESARPRTR